MVLSRCRALSSGSDMPYEVRRVQGGYKVFRKGKGKSYSKRPMSKVSAQAQMRAMYANEKK